MLRFSHLNHRAVSLLLYQLKKWNFPNPWTLSSSPPARKFWQESSWCTHTHTHTHTHKSSDYSFLLIRALSFGADNHTSVRSYNCFLCSLGVETVKCSNFPILPTDSPKTYSPLRNNICEIITPKWDVYEHPRQIMQLKIHNFCW